MKVSGPTGPNMTPQARPTRSAGGFSMAGTTSTSSPAPSVSANAAGGVADVSALMALQGVETATEGRRRGIRRGRGLLDRLDEIKLALLAGESGESALVGLARDLGEHRPDEADAGLKGLLDQIDLRARVELAKAEQRRSAT